LSRNQLCHFAAILNLSVAIFTFLVDMSLHPQLLASFTFHCKIIKQVYTSSWSYLLKHIQPGYCPFEACSLLYFILQGILHHVSVLSEKKEEAENAAKQSKVT